MKLSDWQSCKNPPKLKGWYQCRAHGEPFVEGPCAWRYWTGKRWMWVGLSEYVDFDFSQSPPSSHGIAARVRRMDDWRGVL